MAFATVSADFSVLDREVMHVPWWLEDVPVGDELRLGLAGLGDFFLARGGGFGDDFAGQFAERVSLHSELEGLVVSERRRMDLEAPGDELFFQGRDELLSGARCGE